MTKDAIGKALLLALVLPCSLSLAISCASAPGPKAPAPVRWRDQLFAWPATIDYGSPELYLQGGALTSLSEANRNLIASGIAASDIEARSFGLVQGIYRFMLDPARFNSAPAGGALIAKRDVNRIIAEGTLSGCHDFGIVLAASLRAFGIPAVYLDSASLPWAQARAGGRADIPFEGHIFIEAWIDGAWVVFNSTAPQVVRAYDPANPLLGFTVYKSDRYYVMFKGVDPLGYGIRGNEDIQAAMLAGADRIVAEAARLSPSPKPTPLRSLVPGLGEARALILGDSRIPVETFSARFRSSFGEMRLMSYGNLKAGDLEACDSVVCLIDLSRPPAPPALLLGTYPGIGASLTTLGIHRHESGKKVAIVIVGQSNESLITAIEGFDLARLRR